MTAAASPGSSFCAAPANACADRGVIRGSAGAVASASRVGVSGATGANPATAEERVFLEKHGELAVRASGSYLGHGLEPQFPMNLALATIALQHGTLFPPCDASGLEKPMSGALNQVVVTAVGHWRGEGLALVQKVS